MAAPKRPSNNYLWEQLKDPQVGATKPFTRGGGFRGTQIDPTWRAQRMTEVFGPVGEGWGFVEDQLIIESGMVFSKCRVWYVPPGETPEFGIHEYPNNARWTGPAWGGTEIMRKRGGVMSPDDECFKMSITDAVGKCMVQIGMAAAVYLGQFDDSKYRDAVEEKQRGEADTKQLDADKAAIQTVVDDVSGCLTNAGIDEFVQKHMRVIKDVQARNPGLLTKAKAEIEKYRMTLDDYESWSAEQAKRKEKA